MKVQLLGTGSADGWPNPFCTCSSCGDARRTNTVRGQTGALVDDRLLIDCGPEIPAAAARHGCDFTAVRTMLFTHSHPDHFGPAALLFRHWVSQFEPLTVIGPADPIAQLSEWLAPGDPVELMVVTASDTVVCDGYRISVLAANHGDTDNGEAVLYDIADDFGGRLLYATDTGPLPESTLSALADAELGLILLEETFGDAVDHGTRHLDLSSFPQELSRLRQVRALTDSTDVVAVHLSHDNPPNNQLQRRLEAYGARAVPDGTVLNVPSALAAREHQTRRLHPHRTLVLGGARSGKSTYAEQLVGAATDVTYVATAVPDVDEPDWTARIKAHREQRPASWRTLETTDIADVITNAKSGQVLLVDCLTVWLSRVMDAADAWEGDLSLADKQLDALLDACRHTRAQVVLVSNEVGQGIVPATRSGRLYRDVHGRMNAAVARECDRVVAMWAGRPVDL